MQAQAVEATEANPTPLPDGTVEADEAYQNAGEKGVPHTDPDDPPRRRANKVWGHGTRENDRVPIAGAVGRDSGRLDLKVVRRPDREGLVDDFVLPATHGGAAVYTAAWVAYASLPGHGAASRDGQPRA